MTRNLLDEDWETPDPKPGGCLALLFLAAATVAVVTLIAIATCTPADSNAVALSPTLSGGLLPDGGRVEPTTASTSSSSTTTQPSHESQRRVSRQASPTRVSAAAGAGGAASRAVRVSSTAYCLTGYMASGARVFAGAVAMNNQPFGSRWLVHDGPLAGRVFTVADRIGHGSQFDVAMPGDCGAARRYGRRTITIEKVS